MNLKPPKTLAKPYKIEISIRKGEGKERREEKQKKKNKKKKKNINKKHKCRGLRA
jgi:hypothetical protein